MGNKSGRGGRPLAAFPSKSTTKVTSTAAHQRTDSTDSVTSTPAIGSYKQKVDGKWTPSPPCGPINKTTDTKSWIASLSAGPPTTPNIAPEQLLSLKTVLFFSRKHNERKDIMITATGITPNIASYTQHILPNGKQHRLAKADLFDGQNGNPTFEEFYKALSSGEKIEYFSNKEIEVLVNIPEFNKGHGKTVSDTFRVVGIELAKGAKRVVVYLDCVDTTEDEKAEYIEHGILKVDEVAQHIDHTSPDFVFLVEFVKCLQHISVLEKLDAVVRSKTGGNKVAIPHLKYLLPFYRLNFTKWEMKYLSGGVKIIERRLALSASVRMPDQELYATRFLPHRPASKPTKS
ncbi:hypothetical protein B0J14DRAFT_660385 [Halenospora varia]|nr:hypothetical protein B0J14DRAFT_660385 [Halenospora varia]